MSTSNTENLNNIASPASEATEASQNGLKQLHSHPEQALKTSKSDLKNKSKGKGKEELITVHVDNTGWADSAGENEYLPPVNISNHDFTNIDTLNSKSEYDKQNIPNEVNNLSTVESDTSQLHDTNNAMFNNNSTTTKPEYETGTNQPEILNINDSSTTTESEHQTENYQLETSSSYDTTTESEHQAENYQLETSSSYDTTTESKHEIENYQLEASTSNDTSNTEFENQSENGKILISTSTTIATHTIHLIDGEKGGVGKSFVARALIEYCQYKGLNFAVVDADSSNKDISKIYPGCVEALFSDDEKQFKEADKIFELALKKSVLVNLPAQVYDKVTNWIDNNELIKLGKENGVRFVKWFVCTGGHDSVEFFVKSQKNFDIRLPHVFVRNKGLCDEWSYVDNLGDYKDIKSKYKFVVMDFPKLAHWEKNMVDRLQITFNEACNHRDFGVVSKQKVKNFLKEAFKSFEDTGMLQ